MTRGTDSQRIEPRSPELHGPAQPACVPSTFPKWHIAFCNVTFTEYAGITYRDYYGSPSVMLEAQLKSREHAERRWGAGRFIAPRVDSPGGYFANLFGMPVIEASADEIPYVDTTRPPITDVADADRLRMGDPRSTELMARRLAFWNYYREHGYPTLAFGGTEGNVIDAAIELTGTAVLPGMLEQPAAARRVLEIVTAAHERVAAFGAELEGRSRADFSYTGDDYSGLLSPALYREFAVPCYRRLYGSSQVRFMHSELLRAEHLRIARDELGITEFHGAGCVNLTLAEMREIMGSRFWTQVTPQELLEYTPRRIEARIEEFADSGCAYVQLYPGRGTPERNMDAAVAACRRCCAGGALDAYDL